MAKKELLIIVAFTALVCSSEVDDVEQKKRGVAKATSLNSIPTGAQKQDYTYNIYTQNPSSQSNPPNQSYQSQLPNSFYPSQGSSQYYTSSNTAAEESSGYASQPQVNVSPPSSSSQFVPLNFVPSPGYQSKYQVVPPKSNGNILAIVQQPQSFQASSLVPYHQTLFTPNPTHQISPQNSLLSSISPNGHFAPNYQSLSLGNSYLSQPSSMLLFAHPNSMLYNNLLYPNPVQSLYNYYPSNSQPKYSVPYPSPPTSEYEKLQITVAQTVPREDNDIGIHNSEYTAPSDANTNYKNVYSSSRSTYAKL